MPAMLEVEALVKMYGDFAAVNGVSFSVDEGETWTSPPPEITLVNGQTTVTCRIITEGQVTITASAEDAETATMEITVTTPKDTKTLEMIFTDPDGGEFVAMDISSDRAFAAA